MKRQLVLAFMLVSVGVLSGVHARAQSDGKPLAFEVASIKPNKSGDGRFAMGTERGGRFTASNVTAQLLVLDAYRLEPYQLINPPGWLRSERWDIVAKADGEIPDQQVDVNPATPSALQLLLRELLASRFQLQVHRDQRELPVYNLVFARPERTAGPMLTPSTASCGPETQAAPRDTPPPCTMSYGPDHFRAGTVTLPELAGGLSRVVGRPVHDRTGVSGAFNVELTWSPDQAGSGTSISETSVFTAIQEQLGLKLEPSRGPVDVVVIDHVERPTED